MSVPRQIGMTVRERRSEHLLLVRFHGHENRFLLFGGRDESSAALIQGSTLAGVLLDETALMPRSFVEQAIARCSVPGSRGISWITAISRKRRSPLGCTRSRSTAMM